MARATTVFSSADMPGAKRMSAAVSDRVADAVGDILAHSEAVAQLERTRADRIRRLAAAQQELAEKKAAFEAWDRPRREYEAALAKARQENDLTLRNENGAEGRVRQLVPARLSRALAALQQQLAGLRVTEATPASIERANRTHEAYRELQKLELVALSADELKKRIVTITEDVLM
jgi:hypothetical protein